MTVKGTPAAESTSNSRTRVLVLSLELLMVSPRAVLSNRERK